MMAVGSDAKLLPPLTDAESCSGSYTGAQGHRTKGEGDSLPQLGKTGYFIRDDDKTRLTV